MNNVKVGALMAKSSRLAQKLLNDPNCSNEQLLIIWRDATHYCDIKYDIAKWSPIEVEARRKLLTRLDSFRPEPFRVVPRIL